MVATARINLWLLFALLSGAVTTYARSDNTADIVTVLLEEVAGLKNEVRGLKDVVHSQTNEINNLNDAMASQRRNFQDLESVVKVTKEDVRYLNSVIQEQQLLVLTLQGAIAKQDEGLKAVENRLEIKETFEDFEKLDIGPALKGEQSNASFHKTARKHHQGKPVAVNKPSATKPANPNSHYEENVSEGGDTVSSGRMSRGISSGENVSFSAYMNHDANDMGLGQIVKLNVPLLNDGNGYNPHTGVFTAPISGVYMFTFFLADSAMQEPTGLRLVVDDVHKVDAVSHPISGHAIMGGNSVILKINAGQAVWLQTYLWNDADLRSDDTHHLVTFSGFLLY